MARSHSPCPEEQPRSSSRRDVKRIGQPDQPVRALAFAGGAFDATVQLGVIHALLVIRGKPPDIVVGASAGGIGGVALAEVFQAGANKKGAKIENEGKSPDYEARVAKFREIFEVARNTPGLLVHSLRPDTFQVDTQRPLEPLQLPIHHRVDWEGRYRALTARAGIINLYNALLDLRISFGTLTRAIRRWLGIRAAAEVRIRRERNGSRWIDFLQILARGLVSLAELFRAWALLGTNLLRALPLWWPLVLAGFGRGQKEERGATAAELIFRSRLWAVLTRLGSYIVGGLLLGVFWVTISAIVVGLIALVGLLAGIAVEVLTRVSLLYWASPWTYVGGFAVGTILLAGSLTLVSGRERPRLFGRSAWAIILFLLLVVTWGAVLAVLLAIPPLVARANLLVLEYWIAAEVILFAGAVLSLWGAIRKRKELGMRVLARFGLNEAIFDPHPLRQLLVALFDPRYYGDLDMDAVVDRALRDDARPADKPRGEKLLEHYAASDAKPPIHVALTVADVASGDFQVLPGTYRVVDGLLAGLAAPPLFAPVGHCETIDSGGRKRAVRQLFVDGIVVANEPTRPLFSFLRHSRIIDGKLENVRHLPKTDPRYGAPRLVDRRASALHVYSVVSLPFSGPKLGAESRSYASLVDVVSRALQLKRFRDAALERRLTELHTRAMPEEDGIFFETDNGKALLRTWVFPIEPEQPLRVNERLLQAQSQNLRRDIIAQTVADGCRAALQMMIQPALRSVLEDKNAAKSNKVRPGPGGRRLIQCRATVERYQERQQIEVVPISERVHGRADAGENPGPGLAEVCKHCALYRKSADEVERMLLEPEGRAAPEWPAEGAAAVAPARWVRGRDDRGDVLENPSELRWPREREGTAGKHRPTVSLLFSGGVFRGVFQMGVLNALSEAALRPDIIAGASVGSITGAMVARTFAESTAGPGRSLAAKRLARQRRILRLAAVYLGMDRLILTDRFADFIRGVTVRAAQTGFSLRQADRVFRRFDAANPWSFNRDVRDVVAGLERLTYVSPYELDSLLRAMRLRKSGRVTRLLHRYFQEWLERTGVGLEVLGAEPLARLIKEYVLDDLPKCEGLRPEMIPLDAFVKEGIFLLATATNLTQGELKILGAQQLESDQTSSPPENSEPCPNLLNSLLASSAFPGVFRPRWSWEIVPGASTLDQYIDGGVTDNLPLDAVAEFLVRAAGKGIVTRRPPAPHLLFSASLETQTPVIEDEATLDQYRHNWWALFKRARELAYNQKLDVFARTQRNIRAIMDERKRRGSPPPDWTPLDLEVVTVKPRWLPSTFGFHPMLGFRRTRQAESIAHGCAATLLELGRIATGSDQERDWVKAWGVDPDLTWLPSQEQSHAQDPFRPDESVTEKSGRCWFRPGKLCPFSPQGQEASDAGLRGRTGRELAKIYTACGRRETHHQG